MKCMSKCELIEKSDSNSFWTERDIMTRANSDWIVKMLAGFQDDQHLYMVMEYCPGGDLLTMSEKYHTFGLLSLALA